MPRYFRVCLLCRAAQVKSRDPFSPVLLWGAGPVPISVAAGERWVQLCTALSPLLLQLGTGAADIHSCIRATGADRALGSHSSPNITMAPGDKQATDLSPLLTDFISSGAASLHGTQKMWICLSLSYLTTYLLTIMEPTSQRLVAQGDLFSGSGLESARTSCGSLFPT